MTNIEYLPDVNSIRFNDHFYEEDEMDRFYSIVAYYRTEQTTNVETYGS